jgi:hypothetical protein
VKKLSVVIDNDGLNLGEEEKKMTVTELFTNVVTHVLLSYSQQVKGLFKSERVQYYEIINKLKEAEKNKLEEINLDDGTVGFLKKCFRETKLTPNNILHKVEEKVDAIKDR